MKRPTEGKVLAALARRYKPKAWAFLSHVRNSTGWARNPRTADAIAMSLWPSRGLHLHGFEVKVTRADWMRELNNPEKVEEGIYQFCNFWWVVTVPGVILDASEIPDTWGHLEVKRGRVYTVKEAPALEPKAPSLGFLAAILRNASETMVPKGAVEELADKRIEEAKEGWESGRRWEGRNAIKERDQLLEDLAAFEEASGFREQGLKIASRYEWGANPREIGAAVKVVMGGGLDGQLKKLEQTRVHFLKLASDLKTLLAAADDGSTDGLESEAAP